MAHHSLNIMEIIVKHQVLGQTRIQVFGTWHPATGESNHLVATAASTNGDKEKYGFILPSHKTRPKSI